MFCLFIVIFFVGLYSFCISSFHLLSMLLSLEFLSLVLFFLMILVLWFSQEKYLLMYYLTFCVCEGVLGLSMLIVMVRSVGNDYLQSLMFLKC